MKRIVAYYKNGDRYLKEMGSGKTYYSVHRILAVIYIRPHTCPKSYAWRRTY